MCVCVGKNETKQRTEQRSSRKNASKSCLPVPFGGFLSYYACRWVRRLPLHRSLLFCSAFAHIEALLHVQVRGLLFPHSFFCCSFFTFFCSMFMRRKRKRRKGERERERTSRINQNIVNHRKRSRYFNNVAPNHPTTAFCVDCARVQLS